MILSTVTYFLEKALKNYLYGFKIDSKTFNVRPPSVDDTFNLDSQLDSEEWRSKYLFTIKNANIKN